MGQPSCPCLFARGMAPSTWIVAGGPGFGDWGAVSGNVCPRSAPDRPLNITEQIARFTPTAEGGGSWIPGCRFRKRVRRLARPSTTVKWALFATFLGVEAFLQKP